MDYLIIAGLSFDAISQAFLQLYLAFIDTIVTTLSWFLLLISSFPTVQEKCQAELDASFSKWGKYKENECSFLCATILECQRFRCVADTLNHLVSQDFEINGELISKGTIFSHFNQLETSASVEIYKRNTCSRVNHWNNTRFR